MDLCNPQHTPRVPKLVRETARSMLRHYPTDHDMMTAAEEAPDLFQERMEDLHRFIVKGQLDTVAKAAKQQQLKSKLEFLGLD